MNAARKPTAATTARFDGVEVAFETITPEMAESYLEHNLHNRSLSHDDVAKYARAMAEGRFRINGETIKFSKRGRLIDGQHRLQAIVVSGVPVTMLVVRDLDEDAMVTVDVGRPQNVADLLRLERDNPAYVRELATLARRSMYLQGRSVETRDKTLVFQYAVDHLEELLRAIDVATQPDKRSLVGTRSTYALAAWYLLQTPGISEPAVYAFIDELGSDIGIEEGTPRHVFRRYVSGDPRVLSPTTSVVRERAAVSLFVKTWNAWRDPSKSLKVLRPWHEGQDFPEVEVHAVTPESIAS